MIATTITVSILVVGEFIDNHLAGNDGSAFIKACIRRRRCTSGIFSIVSLTIKIFRRHGKSMALIEIFTTIVPD